MENNATVITNPSDTGDRKVYQFDRSYWSFDGYKEDSQGRSVPDPSHANGDKYCDQVSSELLDNLGPASRYLGQCRIHRSLTLQTHDVIAVAIN
jgi:hypothetical protein